MKRFLPYLLAFAVCSFAFYKLTIKYVPSVIYSRVKTKMMTQSQIKENELRTLPFPTSDSRAVVKPNPDFAYVSTFYNLSDGPLHLSGPMPDSTYWSLALYEPNTNNFYVKNDMEFASDYLNVVIGPQSQKTTFIDDAELINSPGEQGFLLLRILGTKRTESEKRKIVNLLNQLEVKQKI